MTRTTGVGSALLMVVAMACATVAPVKINSGDQCFRCRRTITDTNLAAERITGFVEKFRAPGCMAKYLVAHPEESGPVFVTDYGTGKMMSPEAAFFVPIVLDAVTGETDYRAYKLKVEAEQAAVVFHTVPVDWQTVLDRARQTL